MPGIETVSQTKTSSLQLPLLIHKTVHYKETKPKETKRMAA